MTHPAKSARKTCDASAPQFRIIVFFRSFAELKGMPKRKRQDIAAILAAVFPELAKFTTRSDGLALALTSRDLTKFAKLMHPMLYETWGTNYRFPCERFYTALSSLHWGKLGYGKVIQLSMELQFIVEIIGVRFLIRFNVTRATATAVRRCHVRVYNTIRNDDVVSFAFDFPDVIARHQIHVSLLPLFENAYRTLRSSIVFYLNKYPFLLVGKLNPQCMPSLLWHQVAEKFAELEKEDDLSEDLLNMRKKSTFHLCQNKSDKILLRS
jgi:hypothetical protein